MLFRSALAATGDNPRFVFAFTDATDAAGMAASVAYTTPAPQLCTKLIVPEIACPTGVGVGTGAFPYTGSLGVTSDVSIATGGGSAAVENTSASATLATLTASGCLVPTSGCIYWDTDGYPPVTGRTVYLYGPDGTTVLATAVTDANGCYSFSGLYPNTYQVGTSGGGTGTGIVTPGTELCPPGGDCSGTMPDLYIPATPAQITHTTETCSSVFLAGTAGDLTDLYWTAAKKGSKRGSPMEVPFTWLAISTPANFRTFRQCSSSRTAASGSCSGTQPSPVKRSGARATMPAMVSLR